MSHKIVRLLESLHNRPHLISSDALVKYTEILEDRNNGIFELAVRSTLKGNERREVNYNPDTQIGWVDVNGPLTYITHQGLCGESSAPSYQNIRSDVDTLLASGAKVIVLDMDSPGGEAYGCFETAAHIREAADKVGCKLISYTDGIAASACYGLSSVAHEVIVNPQASVGSIGVVVKLRNANKAMKAIGVEDTYIFAGTNKVAFKDDGEWAEGFLADIQTKIDVMYGEFVSHVAQYRNLDKEQVINTQAKMFSADEAISLGLADRKMTLNQFADYLADLTEEVKPVAIGSIFKLKSEEATLEMTDLTTELQAQLASVQTQLTALSSELVTTVAALAGKEVELTAALSTIATMETEKVEAKSQSRLVALSAVAPKGQAEALHTSLNALSDEAFDTVLAGFSAQKAVLASSDLFAELGDSGSVDAPVKAEASTTDDLITQRLTK